MNQTLVDFIKSKNITYIKGKNDKDIGKLNDLALVKDLLPKDTCFGTFDSTNSLCSSCFLKEKCQELKAHEDSVVNDKAHEDSLGLISVKHKKRNLVFMKDIKTILDQSLYRKGSISYKVAQIILKAHGVDYHDLLLRITKVGKEEYSLPIAKIKFYTIKKQLENRCGIEINIITKKVIEIKDK